MSGLIKPKNHNHTLVKMQITSYTAKQKQIKFADTLAVYTQLPKDQRTFWKLFYITPMFMQIDNISDLFKDGVFETNFDKHFRQNYPVQFFFRHMVPHHWQTVIFPIQSKYTDIRDFLFSQQRWIIKKIPKYWIDKDELITTVMFESIIHFVEHEHSDFDLYITQSENDDGPYWSATEKAEFLKVQYTIRKIYRYTQIRKKVKQRQDNKYSSGFYTLYQHIIETYDNEYRKKTLEIITKLWT